MSLLALASRLRATAQQTGTVGDLPIGTLTNIVQYPQLRYAEVDGIGTVTIDLTANMAGFSPVERCSAGGETAWISTELCKNLRLQPFIGAPVTSGSSR